MSLQPKSSTAANEGTMDVEVNQALELIRQRSPKIVLDTITNIYERGIIDYLTRFASISPIRVSHGKLFVMPRSISLGMA